ncbi:uncharacterized protein PHALS_00836 [Plasmopara halstedii]|uniref:Uncharacterized protein n=1 Tax=Plasmopara halstedii TaxID=4781 RepID=A0A0P1ATH3_PLAHL|nr:uncharacterized protein PHALS_00836 [Plasmopara halstedii]CEG44473.1 hypothetical protein PHALS_00836 [Plasmopara halstedii]|eukprot:XP_024580842.1 hypothetical protein PHALS_00836 [Plasmopara halstedii]
MTLADQRLYFSFNTALTAASNQGKRTMKSYGRAEPPSGIGHLLSTWVQDNKLAYEMVPGDGEAGGLGPDSGYVDIHMLRISYASTKTKPCVDGSTTTFHRARLIEIAFVKHLVSLLER